MQSLYQYFSYIIGSLLFYYLIKNNLKKENNPNNDDESLKLKGIIHNQEILQKKPDTQLLLIICFIFFFSQESQQILYLFKFEHLDFWIIDFIFIFLLMNANFVLNIYRHQKCSIIFIIFTNIIILIISIMANINKKDYKKVEEITDNKYLIIPIIFTFIFLSFLRAYTKVKTKILMYLNFINPYTIIFNIGLIGFIFTLIDLLISSLFKCQSHKLIKYQICSISKNNIDYYIDNIFIYFNNLKNNNLLLEILLITPCYLIICFFEFTCEIMIIYYLNPIYLLIKDNLYSFLLRFILYFIDNSHMTLTLFIIIGSIEAFSLLGYSVYFEIIELRFFGLDKDTKKSIIRRGNQETINILDEENINIYDESFEDENTDNNNENIELKKN